MIFPAKNAVKITNRFQGDLDRRYPSAPYLPGNPCFRNLRHPQTGRLRDAAASFASWFQALIPGVNCMFNVEEVLNTSALFRQELFDFVFRIELFQKQATN